MQSSGTQHLINEYHPSMYFPLETNLINLVSNVEGKISSRNVACNTNIFPYVEQMEFIKEKGYRFNGRNMLSVHARNPFPYDKDARTFVFAVCPTERPASNPSGRLNPMFFFAYGQRKTHECNDGYSNHDKSFGVFWGDPGPNDGIDSKYLGGSVRVFFYCEHCAQDRTSNNCDTVKLCDIEELNKWHVFAVSYNGSKIKFYKNGTIVHDQEYNISTSKSVYLNIGGFVHHDEDGAIIARGIGYSMNGFIREFMMFRDELSGDKIQKLSNNISVLLTTG